ERRGRGRLAVRWIVPSMVRAAGRIGSEPLGVVIDIGASSTRRVVAVTGGAGGMTGAGGGSTLWCSGLGIGSGFGAGSSLRDCCPNSAMCRASLGLGARLPDHRAPAPTPEHRTRVCDDRGLLIT